MREYSLGVVAKLESKLPAELIGKLVQIGTPRKFARGEQIYAQGEQAGQVYLLQYGRVKSTLISASGQESILRLHLPHSILGLTALGSTSLRDARASAIDRVEVMVISSHRLVRFIREEAEFALYLVQLLVDRMSDFHHRVGELQSQTVAERLAHALLALSAPDPLQQLYDDPGHIPFTHEELAQLVNSRRPTVSALIARFVAQGILSRSGRQLAVVDHAQLRRYLSIRQD